MAVTTKIYFKPIEKAVQNYFNEGTNDLMSISHTFKMVLLSAYTFAQTHETLANVLAAGTEVTDGSYARKTLSGLTFVTVNGVTSLKASSPVVWTAATFSATHAVIYDDTMTTPDDCVLACIAFGETKSPNNATFNINLNTGGIATVTVTT